MLSNITYGVIPPEVVAELTGLEFLHATIEGRLPQAPIRELMGISIHAAERGRVEFRAIATERHLNPFGAVQGGWYGVLLDSALGSVVLSCQGKGARAPTLEFKVNIARVLPVGMEVSCVAEIQHSGRRTGVSSAEIRGLEDGKLYASGSTTCIVLS